MTCPPSLAGTAFDPGTRPQDDLWGHVNNRWLATDPIPADRARWGLSDMRRAQVADQLVDLLTACASGAVDGSAEATALGALYAAFLDDSRREQVAGSALAPEMAVIATATDTAGILRAVGRLMRGGIPSFFSCWVLPGSLDPERTVLRLVQDGLTLGDRSAYDAGPDTDGSVGSVGSARPGGPLTVLAAQAPRLLSACLPGAATDGVAVTELAARALDVEANLAQLSWDRLAGSRDADQQTETDVDGLADLLGLDPTPLLQGLGLPDPAAVRYGVAQPTYWSGVGAALRTRPPQDWRAWLTWQLVRTRAPLLHPAAVTAHHRLFAQGLAGQAEPAPRGRRAADAVQALLPWPLAKLYAERHVAPEVAARAQALADELRAAFAEALTRADWIADSTRRTALAKLGTLQVCVGAPDAWRDSAELMLDASDLVGSARTAAAWTADGEFARLHRPTNRRTWGPPPYVVNTFYNPLYHQACITGGYLGLIPPEADDAELFGRIGSILAHELGHAFDSRGAAWDERGRIRDWWTAADRAAFEERVAAVVAQVQGYRPRGVPADASPGGVDGRFVAFECVAELIGMEVAWRAFAARCGGAPTPEQAQRFFLAKAYGRRAADRPAMAAARLRSDPHPPFELFANLARNLDAFHAAFGTGPDDGMWLDPRERVRFYP